MEKTAHWSASPNSNAMLRRGAAFVFQWMERPIFFCSRSSSSAWTHFSTCWLVTFPSVDSAVETRPGGKKRGGRGEGGGGDELHNDADTKRQSAEVTHFGGGHGARRPGEKRQVQVATPLIYTPPPHPCRCTPPAGICEHSSRRVKIFGIFCLG